MSRRESSSAEITDGYSEIDAIGTYIEENGFPKNLGSFIDTIAAQQADKVAIHFIDDGDRLRYAEIASRSNRIAQNLIERGFRKGCHIAVMLPNCAAAILTWFAITKIGGVIIPVNTGYSAKELEYVLSQSDSEAVIVASEFLDKLKSIENPPAFLDDGNRVFEVEKLGSIQCLEAGDAIDVFDPGYDVTIDDIVSIQYTSGTTSFPKGCVLTQKYWLTMSQIVGHIMHQFEIKRSFFWAPFHYMDGQWTFLASLSSGGTAFIVRKMSLSRFLSWLHDCEAEYCILPEAIMREIPSSSSDRKIALKLAHTFGWHPSLRADAEARFNLVARDSFGMTETGAVLLCPRAAGDKLATNTVGITAPFRKTRIVDESGNECLPCEPGEMWVRGDSIMIGYYRQPEANAAVFVDGWYRTGDLFVRDEDGYHRIIGRIKEMIKRSGENIAAAEIERIACGFPGVAEAAALAVPDALRREEVLLLVKPIEATTIREFNHTELISHFRNETAKYKCPRYIGVEYEFPKTPTNKIAKSKLKEGLYNTKELYDSEKSVYMKYSDISGDDEN